MVPRRAGIFLLLAFAPVLSEGQEAQRTPESTLSVLDTLLRRNAATILFDRNLNTYDWTGRLMLDTSVGGNSVKMAEQFSSNIILVTPVAPSATRKLISDQQILSLELGRPIMDGVSSQVRWSSFQYSDNKAVGLSNTSINALLGGFEYTPAPFVAVTPMAGYRWERQADITDHGLSLDLGARTLPVELEGYRIVGSAQYHRDRLDPRTLESNFARAGVQKSFGGLTRDSIEFGVSRNRREFYALADSNIESRLEDIVSFSNLLDYELAPRLVTSVYVGINSLGLDKDLRSTIPSTALTLQFNTRIAVFSLDSYVQAQYRSADNQTAASVRLYHSERNETHAAKPIPGASPNVQILFEQSNAAEQGKNNLTRRTSLDGALMFPVTSSDRIALSGAVSILRYDTPSPVNVEDRDELLISASLSTEHHVNRYLDIGIELDGNLSHLVYLLSERSANNNYNRVLRLAPRTLYRPFRFFSTMNTFEVLANYTVYDFEEQLAQVRSYSYRQFSWIDSSAVDLTQRIGFDIFVYWKVYERGQLKWSDFAERTQNFSVDRTYAAQVRFTPDPRTVFAVGFRYFGQTRYVYNQGVKQLDSFVSSVGPTCALLWRMGERSMVNVRGWYEQRKQPAGTQQSLASMTLSILVNF